MIHVRTLYYSVVKKRYGFVVMVYSDFLFCIYAYSDNPNKEWEKDTYKKIGNKRTSQKIYNNILEEIGISTITNRYSVMYVPKSLFLISRQEFIIKYNASHLCI